AFNPNCDHTTPPASCQSANVTGRACDLLLLTVGWRDWWGSAGAGCVLWAGPAGAYAGRGGIGGRGRYMGGGSLAIVAWRVVCGGRGGWSGPGPWWGYGGGRRSPTKKPRTVAGPLI